MKLNDGSLYAVVASLEKRRLISAFEAALSFLPALPLGDGNENEYWGHQ